jgi:hypothetical protein
MALRWNTAQLVFLPTNQHEVNGHGTGSRSRLQQMQIHSRLRNAGIKRWLSFELLYRLQSRKSF